MLAHRTLSGRRTTKTLPFLNTMAMAVCRGVDLVAGVDTGI